MNLGKNKHWRNYISESGIYEFHPPTKLFIVHHEMKIWKFISWHGFYPLSWNLNIETSSLDKHLILCREISIREIYFWTWFSFHIIKFRFGKFIPWHGFYPLSWIFHSDAEIIFPTHFQHDDLWQKFSYMVAE